jgi:hypothetical protein
VNRHLNQQHIMITSFLALCLLFLPACAPVVTSTSSLNPTGFATFEGTVFVVTTEVVNNLWKGSGWVISDQPLNTNDQTIPLDCTLYPHAEVTNQWIGGCTGRILVPRNGAEHIAVMVSNQDGSMTVVQVAPQPHDLSP